MFEFFDAKVRMAIFSLLAVGLGARLFLRGPTVATIDDPAQWDAAVWIVLVLIGLGLLLPLLGNRRLPDDPRAALLLFESSSLLSLAIVAVLTAGSLAIAVRLAPEKGAEAPDAEAAKTIAAAVAAVLSAVVVSISGSSGADRAGSLTKRKFRDHYKRANYANPSRIPQIAQSNNPEEIYPLTGWGWDARRARAEEIDRILKNPPPPAA